MKFSMPFIGAAFLLVAVSCKKENNNVSKISYEDGVSRVIYDMAGDTRASVGAGVDEKEPRPFKTFLLRLRDGKQSWDTSAAFLQTGEWDLAFTDIYNALILVNNGQDENSPGYGSKGKAAVVYFDKAYGAVTEAPSDEYFAANDLRQFGWDGYPQPRNKGWYFYSTANHIARPLKNRIWVIRTAEGKFAKLEMINIYQGNPPAITDLLWPAPYFTIRYFVQEDGSRNLTTPPAK